MLLSEAFDKGSVPSCSPQSRATNTCRPLALDGCCHLNRDSFLAVQKQNKMLLSQAFHEVNRPYACLHLGHSSQLPTSNILLLLHQQQHSSCAEAGQADGV